MSIIGPPQTLPDLEESASAVREGRAKRGLPAVKSDALTMRKMEEYEKNRDLAHRISTALTAVKLSDEHGPLFVLGWRMYPNAEHPHWKEVEGSHTCGCACACAAPEPHPHPHPAR